MFLRTSDDFNPIYIYIYLIFAMDAIISIGLLHDVGHGPFSHLFEREFLPQVISGSDW